MRGTYSSGVYRGVVRLSREDIGVRPFIRLREFGGARSGGEEKRKWGSGLKMRDRGARSRTNLRALVAVIKRRKRVERMRRLYIIFFEDE